MNTVHKDRATLKRLVESYGKADVEKYIKHLDESRQDDMDAAQNCAKLISRVVGGLDEGEFNQVMQLLEDLIDKVQNEPYELGFEEGKRSIDYDETYEEGYEKGYKEGHEAGYHDMYDKIESRGFFGRMRNPKTLLIDDD